jgi:hypothetical protein
LADIALMDVCPVCGGAVLFARTDKGKLVALEESADGCFCVVGTDRFGEPVMARTLVHATGEPTYALHQD